MKIQHAVRSGARFMTPLHRGAQSPMEEPDVQLENFSKEIGPCSWHYFRHFSLRFGNRLPFVDLPSKENFPLEQQKQVPSFQLRDMQSSDEESGDSSADEGPSLGPADEFLFGRFGLPGLMFADEYAYFCSGLSEALIKVATDAGWTLSTFRHAADSPADLEKAIPEIFGSSELSRLQIAQIRAAWAGLSSSASSAPPSAPTTTSEGSSWVETFAPKITASTLTEYKKTFLAAYTSEILSPSTMPSLRLVSLAARQESKKDYKWIPWKHRMSEEKAAELQLSRPTKQPRLEALGLSSLLLDEPPTLEVGDSYMDVSAVQRILAIHDIALAMVGSSHLARLKGYSSKFMHLLSQRYEASSGLRPPTVLEAQQADCKLWQGIYALVLEKDWSLNDAIFEYTEVRGDMCNLLQARARPLPSPRFNEKGFKGKGLGRFMSEHWKGQGYDGKGKSPGKDKGAKGKTSGKGSSGSWVKNVLVNGELRRGHLVTTRLWGKGLEGWKAGGAGRLEGGGAGRLEGLKLEGWKAAGRLEGWKAGGLKGWEEGWKGEGWSRPSAALAALANIPQRFFLDICSGVTKPLSSAVEASGFATLSIDILLDPALDLLRDDFFEQLLFICGSGAVGYCAASPSCSHYSRLKLSGGPPFPIRTPEYLDGVPGLGPSDLAKLQESKEILSRTLLTVLASRMLSLSYLGGSLWGYGLPWAKTWLFASSYAPLRNMGCVCEHGRDAHPVMRGLDGSGLFKSRKTAQYPEALATTFAAQIRGLLEKSGPPLSVQEALTLVPRKPMDQLPWAVHDGAGRHSHADWRAPCTPDFLRNLRSFLLQVTASMCGPARLLQRRNEPSKEPLFSASEVALAREGFFSALGIAAPANAWSQRAHQPLCLHALEAVAQVSLDPDTTLFPALKAGVQTGFQADIPPSNCFWPNIRESLDDVPLSIHLQNWRSATVEPAVARRLLQEELDQGFCFKFEGSLADAQQRWPLGEPDGSNALYFYRTCPFGATFAQHWWGRLGSCILRILRILIYIAHTGRLWTITSSLRSYLFFQQQIMGVPLSWHKLQISVRVTWIGWDFQYSAGIVLLKESKRLKLLGMVQDLRKNPRLTKKDLERFIGLALWATSLFPVMKSMLHTFYHDLYSPAATNYSIPPEPWHELPRYLTPDLHFTVTPPGTGIPLNSKLLSARHQDLHSLQDLDKVRVSDRRVWLRVSSENSKKRKLSLNSLRILGIFEHWLLHMSPFRSMRQPATPLFDARANVSARGSHCCIGGYVRHPSLGHRWFQQTFAHADFLALGIGVQADMARGISCYEALAQAALILAASALLPCSCVPITLRALSDNTGAESGLNNSLTTSQPLCFFLERISLLAAVHRITPDVSHIPGEDNDKADALSRPQEHSLPPDCFQHERISATLQDLWLPRPMISVSPSSVQLPWQIRSRGVPTNLT
ncbi:unnamed protein product [Symbiodinium sp. CCMP2592]|nr:unnamed protein product [Symbiodinium sp. CCMP2592]